MHRCRVCSARKLLAFCFFFLSKPTAVRTRSHQKAILRSGLPFLLTKSKLGVVGIMASQATLDLVYNVFFVIIVV